MGVNLSWHIRRFIKYVVGVIPKNKNLLLFSAWFGQKYADSTMYQFEYMLNNTTYNVYWFTKNKDLFKQLKGKNIPVVYSKSLKGFWLQSRAIMLLSTVQTCDFNQYLLNKCIFLDLDHGFPGKPVGLSQPTVNDGWRKWYNFFLKGLDFYQTASSRFVVDYLSPCYNVQPDHYLFCNKPRIDVLFNADLQKSCIDDINKIKANRKALVYLPTHRACGKNAMPMNEILDLKAIQKCCEETNSVFIIKKHFYHKHEVENLDNYPNIIDITQSQIDTQILLSQTDVLVTDFSSCYNDFLALNRPIIFYAFDYEDYLIHDRDYYWKYDKINAGYTCKSKDEFTNALMNVSKDFQDTLHQSGRLQMREIYFDHEVEMGTTREKLTSLIGQLIDGTYTPYDWTKK